MVVYPKDQGRTDIKDAEVNLMNNEEIIVPLTRKLRKKEWKLARYKVRYLEGNITPLQYVSRIVTLEGEREGKSKG